MRSTMKVAKWEIKRNMKNKSFIIGLFLTPILFIVFAMLGSLFGNDSSDDNGDAINVFVNDQLNIYPAIEEMTEASDLNWNLQVTDAGKTEALAELDSSENTAYVFIDEQTLESGVVPYYTSEEIDNSFQNQIQLLQSPLQAIQIEQLGLTTEEAATLTRGIQFEEASAEAATTEQGTAKAVSASDTMEQIVPAAFAGFIMLSIVFTGMAIFQSASQEKKDKIAEIILSSLTPADLMQGKIIGYFVLGLIQVVVSFLFIIPFILWKTDIPLFEYLFVPETIIMVAIAILSYLMFAAIFVGIGATMEDMTTAGNFQGLVMMLPFLPFIFIGPVFSDPSGLWAQIGTYIPFTAPGVLLMRLASLEEWPWIEIIISLVIILASVWIFMKLAGKIFKTGILMYGKNATPAEIWKWIRS